MTAMNKTDKRLDRNYPCEASFKELGESGNFYGSTRQNEAVNLRPKISTAKYWEEAK